MPKWYVIITVNMVNTDGISFKGYIISMTKLTNEQCISINMICNSHDHNDQRKMHSKWRPCNNKKARRAKIVSHRIRYVIVIVALVNRDSISIKGLIISMTKRPMNNECGQTCYAIAIAIMTNGSSILNECYVIIWARMTN